MKSSNPFALWRWEKMFGQWQMFGEGFLRTIEVAALAIILALALGIVFGVISTSNNKILRGIARVYVEFFQNTPLVIQVFFMYNGLAIAGLRLSVFTIGVLGVGIYHGAYVSEVVKAGIHSIPVGQVEAAKSQGFTYVQYMRYIILPQTIKIILPPLTNQAVNLIKNTSVLAMISGFDLMYMADSVSRWQPGHENTKNGSRKTIQPTYLLTRQRRQLHVRIISKCLYAFKRPVLSSGYGINPVAVSDHYHYFGYFWNNIGTTAKL
jgi:putative glutamine transport system permease protein